MILLDADTGAILAAAQWPGILGGGGAFDKRPDPRRTYAWEVIDSHSTPGSTMVPVLTLALAIAGGERLKHIMLGLTPGEMTKKTGLSPDSGSYQIHGTTHTIQNFGMAPIGAYFRPLHRSPACAGAAKAHGTERKFSAANAIAYGVNNWTARLAVLAEEQTIQSYTQELRRRAGSDGTVADPGTAAVPKLLKTLRAIGISDIAPGDLGWTISAFVQWPDRRGPMLAAPAANAVTSTAYPGGRTVDYYRGRYAVTIARNGIGKGWRASALHLGHAAALMASGRKLRPFLISRFGARPVAPSELPRLDLDARILTELKVGMKAVTETTTARAIFRFRPGFIAGVDLAGDDKGAAEVKAKLGGLTRSAGYKPLSCRVSAKSGHRRCRAQRRIQLRLVLRLERSALQERPADCFRLPGDPRPWRLPVRLDVLRPDRA